MTYQQAHTRRLAVQQPEGRQLEPFPSGFQLDKVELPLGLADVECSYMTGRSNFHNFATPHSFANIARNIGCNLDHLVVEVVAVLLLFVVLLVRSYKIFQQNMNNERFQITNELLVYFALI